MKSKVVEALREHADILDQATHIDGNFSIRWQVVITRNDGFAAVRQEFESYAEAEAFAKRCRETSAGFDGFVMIRASVGLWGWFVGS